MLLKFKLLEFGDYLFNQGKFLYIRKGSGHHTITFKTMESVFDLDCSISLGLNWEISCQYLLEGKKETKINILIKYIPNKRLF